MNQLCSIFAKSFTIQHNVQSKATNVTLLSRRLFSTEEGRRRRKRPVYRNNSNKSDTFHEQNENQQAAETTDKPKKKINRGPFSCTAYQTASEYKLNSFEELRNFFQDKTNYTLKIMGDIIHIQYEKSFVPKQANELLDIVEKREAENSGITDAIVPFEFQDDEELQVDHRKDIFYFTKEGCVVCWGTHPSEDFAWRTKIKPFEIEPSSLVLDESAKYMIGRYTGISSDRVVFDEHNTDIDTVEQKLAFSCGLVRSLRLEVVEMILEKSLLRIVDIPKQLENGILPKSEEWTKIIGEQIKIRGSVNFYSQLLEPPEMFWERPELEMYFSKMQQHLDIPHRISLVNKRLDYSQYVTEVIRSYVTDHHSHYLEQIIILLIFIEVLFYIADKSETWRDFTFESAYRSIFNQFHETQITEFRDYEEIGQQQQQQQ